MEDVAHDDHNAFNALEVAELKIKLVSFGFAHFVPQ